MKKLKKLFSSSRTNIAAVAVAAAMIVGVSVGVAFAASRVQMSDIGVSLLENGEKISWRNYVTPEGGPGEWVVGSGVLLTHMLDETDGKLAYNHAYTENLAVENTGSINEYVRVSIFRYWEDPNSLTDKGEPKKLTGMLPEYIDLSILADDTGIANGWVVDTQSSTPERVVLYYTRLLNAGETTPDFSDFLTINSAVDYDTNEDGLSYKGMRFILRVDVDGVQEHNADDAIQSAWGRHVTVSDGILSLN